MTPHKGWEGRVCVQSLLITAITYTLYGQIQYVALRAEHTDAYKQKSRPS